MRAEQDFKTLDVKILELKEDPDNLQLLFDVMAQVFQDEDRIRSGEIVVNDFDVVNYILANALKGDLISHEQLGLVMFYLETVQAPSIYY